MQVSHPSSCKFSSCVDRSFNSTRKVRDVGARRRSRSALESTHMVTNKLKYFIVLVRGVYLIAYVTVEFYKSLLWLGYRLSAFGLYLSKINELSTGRLLKLVTD